MIRLRGFGRNGNKPASPKREARASCFRSAFFRLILASRFGLAILLAVRSAFFPNALKERGRQNPEALCDLCNNYTRIVDLTCTVAYTPFPVCTPERRRGYESRTNPAGFTGRCPCYRARASGACGGRASQRGLLPGCIPLPIRPRRRLQRLQRQGPCLREGSRLAGGLPLVR